MFGRVNEDVARYRVFTRTWWRRNAAWPNGLEPCPGRQTTLARDLTIVEARAKCAEWNAANKPGPLGNKAEFEQQ